MFAGRTDELKEAYQSDKFESVILYGRRVGKTELIKESLKDYDGIVIHYECKKTSVMANLKMMAKLFCDKLNLGNCLAMMLFYFEFIFESSKYNDSTCVIYLILKDDLCFFTIRNRKN